MVEDALIDTPRQYFELILEPTFDEYFRNHLSARHAVLASIVVFQMHDRIRGRNRRTGERYVEDPDRPEINPMVVAVGSIVNDTKHLGRVHLPSEGGDFNNDFSPLDLACGGFYIQVESESWHLLNALYRIKEYWKTRLDGSSNRPR